MRVKENKVKIASLLMASLLLSAGCLQQGRGDGSLAVGRDLGELASSSDVILMGTVDGAQGTRNLARLVSDPAKEAPDVIVLGQDFSIRLDDVIKGNVQTGSEIVVSVARWHGVRGQREGTDQNYVPLRIGSQYVLFLRSLLDGSGAYGQALEPFRFVVTDGTARVESKWSDAPKYFPSRPIATLVADIRSAVR